MTGGAADSAGRPWSGRHFEPNSRATDDGSAPPALLAALEAFGAGEAGAEVVVAAVRGERLLIPLLAQLGEAGQNADGVTVDKSAELAIVTVAGPDGRDVLPAFTSVAAMTTWNRAARPVPAEAERVALAAVQERTDLIVLDPGSPTEFALRRPAVWALASGAEWLPSPRDERVRAAVQAGVAEEPAVVEALLAEGDPAARLRGPELIVRLRLVDGLGRGELEGMLARVQGRWAQHPLIAEAVDSLAVRLESASVS